MPATAERLEIFNESVIREMTRVADQYRAINLAQGYPDFDPPPELPSSAAESLQQGYNQYSITWGSPRFRQALANKQSHFMGVEIDPDIHITVTCGSTEAMMAALISACVPEDKVIIFSPFYENYGPDTILSSAEPVFVPLHPPGFKFDPGELQHTFQRGVQALVLCNPSNPSGKVFTRDELLFISDLAKEYDVFIITDEVYEHIIYETHQHAYIASLPGMFERTISCSSLSKTCSITGWRLGYVIAPETISTGVRKVHDFLTVGAPAPLQEAAVSTLNFPNSYYLELQSAYTRRRDTFLGFLDQIGLNYTIPQGAYYVLIDISPFGFSDDMDFCLWMAKEIGIAAVPGSSFFRQRVNHLVRLYFAKRDDTLAEIGARLSRLPERL